MIKIDLGSAAPGTQIESAASQAREIAAVVRQRWWGQPVVSFVFNDTRVTLDSYDSVESIVERYQTARRLGINS